MSEIFLTDGIIKKKRDILAIFPSCPFTLKSKFNIYPYILIVQLLTKTFAKLTIYPLNRDRVLKIIFRGFDIQNKNVEIFINQLKNFGIIHTSGITILGKKFYYECYLEKWFDDEDYKDLKNVLDKIKNVFEDIKIEEIYIK
ncbi:MAG: hypothetical protein P8Y23_03050 [Candidatus Lokiarchaeota archaeon]|jgi:hypothetical protein